jgi:FAD/FMN-containing dehydrogenase
MAKAFMRMVSNPFSNIPPLYSDLAKTLVGEIDCSQETLSRYSTDNSPYTIRPQAIIYPKESTDIKHVLAFSREYKIPVTVRGSGTGSQGGSLGEGIILDMGRYFTHVRHINMLEQTITVDAGVTVKMLRERLHGWNVDVPVLTAQDNDATIGGLFATKSATPTSFVAGTIREWVESVTVVIDNGEEHILRDGTTPSGRLLGIYQELFPLLTESSPIIRAHKPSLYDDATGYSVWSTSIGPRQLIDELAGSEGTLAIITAITLRLVPHKHHCVSVCIPIRNTDLITTYVDIAKHHRADHLYLYDGTFMELVDRYHYEITPSFPDANYVLVCTYYNNDREALHQEVRNFSNPLPALISPVAVFDDKRFVERITDFSFTLSLCDAYTQGSYVPCTFGNGIIVPIHNYGALIEDLADYVETLGKMFIITGNVGSGHLSIITLFDPQSPTYKDELARYTKALFTYAKKYKGGISAIDGDGLTRSQFLSYIYNEQANNIFKKIKTVWDPLSILNPGKKISLPARYLEERLRGPKILP